jgi:hypothetical protein
MHRISRRTADAGIVALGIGLGLALGIALGACDRPKAPVNGIGGFVLAKTTLASVANQGAGQCFESSGHTSCLLLAQQSIAGRSPQIQLEFAGNQSDAVLRRILMEIPGCVLGETRAWFEERLGKPDRSDDAGALWQQTYMVTSVRVTGPSRCQVVAVDPVDEPNVTQLLDAYKSAPPAPGN